MEEKHGPFGFASRRPRLMLAVAGIGLILLSLSNLAMEIVLDVLGARGTVQWMFGMPVDPWFGFGVIPMPIYFLTCIVMLAVGIALVLAAVAWMLAVSPRR